MAGGVQGPRLVPQIAVFWGLVTPGDFSESPVSKVASCPPIRFCLPWRRLRWAVLHAPSWVHRLLAASRPPYGRVERPQGLGYPAIGLSRWSALIRPATAASCPNKSICARFTIDINVAVPQVLQCLSERLKRAGYHSRRHGKQTTLKLGCVGIYLRLILAFLSTGWVDMYGGTRAAGLAFFFYAFAFTGRCFH